VTIQAGDRLPKSTFLKMNDNGPEALESDALFAGRRVALFGLPGAFTGTCSTLHLPSFMRVAPALREKGVDAIICISVNDPFVMKAWGEATGGAAAGIEFLADAEGQFTKDCGLDFTTSQTGLIGRCLRFAAFAEDGVVTVLNFEEQHGTCVLTAGETLLEQINP